MQPPLQYFRFLIIYLILNSCSHSRSPIVVNSTDNTDTVKVQLLTFDLKKLPDKSTVKLSEIEAVEIKYIPLKTTPQDRISYLYNIIFSNNYFLTRDFSSIKSPKMFRYDGSFFTEVGTNGKGPNEFISFTDMDINPKDESIYIADRGQPKLLVINKNGEFIRTIKSPLGGEMKFRFTEDEILCYYENGQGNIKDSFLLIDTTGKIIKKFRNRYPWKRTFPGARFEFENIFYRFNNQLYKKEIYCDTVFVYNNKKFEPHLIIDVGGQRLTPDVRKRGKTFSDAEYILHNFINPYNLFEFSDFIYYEFGITRNGKRDLYAFIGSKNNNFKALVLPHKGLINDIDGGPNIWPKTIKDDNTLVSWIEALKLKEYIASDAFKNSLPKYPDKKKELENLANSIHENDNPILILIKLK